MAAANRVRGKADPEARSIEESVDGGKQRRPLRRDGGDVQDEDSGELSDHLGGRHPALVTEDGSKVRTRICTAVVEQHL